MESTIFSIILTIQLRVNSIKALFSPQDHHLQDSCSLLSAAELNYCFTDKSCKSRTLVEFNKFPLLLIITWTIWNYKLVNTSFAGGWFIHHTKFLNHQIPWCLEYLIRLSLSEDAAEVVDNLIK